MKPGFYTNAILTAIALLLAVCAVRLSPQSVRAQNAETNLQFDPDIRQVDVPGGSGSFLGRIAIDTETGNVYGFPTEGRPYPWTLNSGLAVSKPVLLGRFELGNLPQK